MDRYSATRRLIETVSQEVLGMDQHEARKHIEGEGLRCRAVRIDGAGCMITADVKMDRIGLEVSGGVVVGTRNG